MVIPAQTGILRHSREDENPPRHPSFPRRRESTIPAHAGIHRPTTPTPEKKHSVIPAKAGIHNSRARGNSSSHHLNARKKILRYSREGRNPPRHPSFPRRRESTPSSVIPAKAGIHNSRTRGNSSSHHPNARKKTLRHSREGGNPQFQFPRTREFIVPPPQRPKKNTPSFPRRQESTPSSVIPAKAGIHNSRTRGNSSSHYPNTRKNTPSFPPSRE